MMLPLRPVTSVWLSMLHMLGTGARGIRGEHACAQFEDVKRQVAHGKCTKVHSSLGVYV